MIKSLAANFSNYTYYYVYSNPFAGINNLNKLIQARLVSGQDAHEGRIEILYADVWGAICDDLFNLAAANVVCRQLGYPGAVRIASSYGSDSTQIWLDDVQCIGNETSIVQCSHSGFNIYDCNFDADQVGVECIGELHKCIISVYCNSSTVENFWGLHGLISNCNKY